MNSQRILYRYEFELPNSIVNCISKQGENFNTQIPVAEDSIGILSNVIVSKENDIVKLYITVNKDELKVIPDDEKDDYLNENYENKLKPETFEHCTQTEPVTIIIGDASMILDKIHKSEGIVKGAGDSSKILSFPRQQPKGRPTNLARQGKQPGRATNVIDYSSIQTSAPSVQTNYSCPLCNKTFSESPLLYDHLQSFHYDQCKKIKKPKGREGKTIYLRNRTPSIPMISPLLQQQQQHQIEQQQQHQRQQQQRYKQVNVHRNNQEIPNNRVGEVYLDPINTTNVQVAECLDDDSSEIDGQIVYTTVDYVDSFNSDINEPSIKRHKDDDDLIEDQVSPEMIILN